MGIKINYTIKDRYQNLKKHQEDVDRWFEECIGRQKRQSTFTMNGNEKTIEAFKRALKDSLKR